jgi:endonuclease/exonuclease/phosphatase family metal-dependent hydrolase
MRESLKLATFNLLNLRLPGESIYGRPGYTDTQFSTKIQWIAQQLDRIAPDVVIFQEVFSEQALQLACGRSRRFSQGAKVGAPFAVAGNELPRVGFASLIPLIGEPESITDIAPDLRVMLPGSADGKQAGSWHEKFSRPVLRLTLNLNGGTPRTDAESQEAFPMGIIGLHLKSRRPELLDSEDGDLASDELRGELRALMIRGAEAASVRQMVVDSTNKNRVPMAVLGDFNDALQSVTTELIAGSAPLHEKEKRDTVLFSAHGLQGSRGMRRDVAYSHVHQADPQVIDHILLSEEFSRESRFSIGEVVKVDYYNDHLNDRDPLTSDHAVVAATMRLYRVQN